MGHPERQKLATVVPSAPMLSIECPQPPNTRSKLQFVVSNILYNNLIKYDVHLKSFVKIDV